MLPSARVRPQGGGIANIDDEAVFAAIIYVLVSGCAWLALPPCFGASKSTVHRRFAIWWGNRIGVRIARKGIDSNERRCQRRVQYARLAAAAASRTAGPARSARTSAVGPVMESAAAASP